MTHHVRARSVVFVNRFYWPDVAATGQILTDLCEDLAAHGWEVTVLTGRATYESESAGTLLRESHRGVRIIKVAGTRFGRDRMIGRILDYASYSFGVAGHLLFGKRASIIVGLTDPPMIMTLVLLAARLRRSRAVHWSQDVFPALAAQLGALRSESLLFGALRCIAQWTNARCDLIVALGPRMVLSMVSGGARPDRVQVVHNWADTDAITPIPAAVNPFLRDHDLQGRFVVLYSGNAGRAHTFDALLEAARRLREDRQIVFLFIGGGKRTDEIRRFTREHGLENVRFMDYMPRTELAHSLSAASLSVVTEDPRASGLLVPSKMYGILASGRPILFVGCAESDVAAVVNAADCGRVVAQDDSDGVVAAIRELAHDPALAEAMGRNARRAADGAYSRRHATARWRSLLAECLAN